MKILVVTKEAQGRRRDDFCFADEGDVVRMPIQCSTGCVNGGCECRRALESTQNKKWTTTCKVIERADMTFEKLYAMLDTHVSGELSPETTRKEALYLASIAGQFTHGTVIERCGERFTERVTGVYAVNQRLGAVMRHIKIKRGA